MHYDVGPGFSFGDPPIIRRLRANESDGSCTSLREAKVWYLRELDDWVIQTKQDLKELRAVDVRYDW